MLPSKKLSREHKAEIALLRKFWQDPGYTYGEKAVWQYLYYRLDAEHACCPSYEVMQPELRMGSDTLTKILQSLQAKSCLTIQSNRPWAGSSSQKSFNSYHLLVPPSTGKRRPKRLRISATSAALFPAQTCTNSTPLTILQAGNSA